MSSCLFVTNRMHFLTHRVSPSLIDLVNDREKIRQGQVAGPSAMPAMEAVDNICKLGRGENTKVILLPMKTLFQNAEKKYE